jgi:ABC-2 type transport system ATP-binding protein
MASISVNYLTKTYQTGVQALAGVSFSVKPGEIFGLLGPNGAGKSTTVRILATLTSLDGGHAEVGGHDVAREAAAVRRQIGYVAQTSGVDKFGTGRENLTLQAHLQRVPSKRIAERVAHLLDWVDLTAAADRLVRTYSGGMKRRLDIAMGLVHEPAILFLDEPTTGLDPETRSALWRDLHRLRKERNITVLLTTHYMEEADKLCDRLAIVDHGRVVIEGTPGELKEQIRGDTVTLEMGDSEGTTRAADLLGTIDGVGKVIKDGSAVIAQVMHGAKALPVLVTALERDGVGVRAVTLSRASLDDVYLYHTGHRYTADGFEIGSQNGRVAGEGAQR